MTRSTTTKRGAAAKPKAAEPKAVEPKAVDLEPVDAVAHVPGVGHIPEGTPVRAAGGEVGRVLSHDPITGQVQITFDKGGRGWFRPGSVSLVDAEK